ncbi:MAG: ABC transporter ATP-binding protein [Spirochaetes bacterium]|nr:ABC transporter ATP-binding protein [Spirochaetota bacterium]
MSGAAVLELRDVHKAFRSPDGSRSIPVLNGVSLAIGPGETVAVVGPSGSGKSTLLALMGGLDVSDRGSVLLDGADLAAMGDRERAQARSRRIGFVFQSHRLLPQCSAWENVLVPTIPVRRAGAAAEGGEPPSARARRLLERVGLADRLGHRPAELSGGECLRVAVARALVNRPRLLLADEPTGSLDERSARELAELLVEVNREEGTSLVVVTHSVALASLMGRRLELHSGVLAG